MCVTGPKRTYIECPVPVLVGSQAYSLPSQGYVRVRKYIILRMWGEVILTVYTNE